MRAVLTYHSIDSSGSPISCSPETFERHVAWLAGGRVRVTTVDDLLTLPDTVDAVALTFDDGFVNFRDEAAPRLREQGFPATLFVVAGRVGQTNSWDDGPDRVSPEMPLLDWPDLIRLQEQGFSLGAHSVTHRSLPDLSPAEIADEVQGCAELIERNTGHKPAGFAYPFGHRNTVSSDIVSRTFQWACTTEFQPVTIESQPLALPRLDMYYFESPGSLDDWGTPWFKARLRLRHGLRSVRRAVAP